MRGNRTVRYWLNTIRDSRTRKSGLKQSSDYLLNRHVADLENAISTAFMWSASKEGASFWVSACYHHGIKRKRMRVIKRYSTKAKKSWDV